MKTSKTVLIILLIFIVCHRRSTMKLYEKPVTFTRDGLQIVGMLHIPQKTSPKYPAILLLHGFTGHKAESHFMFTQLARSLANSGFICLRFDFIGSGDSEGEFKDMTILTELQDARTALQFLMSQPEVDLEKIGLLGLSMGGCVAALLAGENPSIKSLVLWSAVAHPAKLFQSMLDNLPKVLADNQRWYIDYGGFAIGDKFFNVLPAVQPLEVIASFKGPVLIIHGSNDLSVPLSSAREYRKVLNLRDGAQEAELDLIEDADHVFSRTNLTGQVIDRTVDWFLRTLR